jgi:hypothetical protein
MSTLTTETDTVEKTPTLQAFRELDDGLWVAERPQGFLGTQIGTRMTVIRLPDGGLFVHSPVPLGWQTRHELDGMGTVKAVVAPNRFHHLYVRDFVDQFPNVPTFAAPGLQEKRSDLRFRAVLSDAPDPIWEGSIDQVVFRAMPLINEVIFCHKATRTLLLTDLAFNVHTTASRLTRLVLQLDGIFAKFGVGKLEKRFIRDHSVARRCIDQVLAWDFDRIILAHGKIVDTGGKEMMREAFAWL